MSRFVRSARVLIPAIGVVCFAAILVGQEQKPGFGDPVLADGI